MHLLAAGLISLLFATSIHAAPAPAVDQPLKRDLSTVASVLVSVRNDLIALDAAVLAFNGDAINAVPILEAADRALTTINFSIPTVRETSSLGLIASVGVLVPVGFLYATANTLVTDLIAKKSQFDSAGLSVVVQDKLGQFQKQAGQLVDVTVRKIPAYLSIISTPIGNSIITLLDGAVTAYGLPAATPLPFATISDALGSIIG